MNDSSIHKSEKILANPAEQKLNFIWLELTSHCNLRCVHCYAESGPTTVRPELLSISDYRKLIESAASLGCKNIQFIGGEPTIVRELPDLITYARNKGFEFIEVFTNATILSDRLLSCFVENNVSIATSFYSYKSEIHDSITKIPGSHSQTVNNIKRFLDASLNVRAGIIVMEENENDVDETIEYLHSIGIKTVGKDRIRSFGRGNSKHNHTPALTELCGSCWQGNLCVFPDGKIAPCIMSREWSIGSIFDEEFEKLVQSQQLKDLRKKIYQEVWLPRSAQRNKVQSSEQGELVEASLNNDLKDDCVPDCVPTCNPQCSPNCSPCFPYGKCNPELF